MRRRVIAAAAWLLSLPALSWGSARACDALGSRIAAQLAAFLPALVEHGGEPKPPVEPLVRPRREPKVESECHVVEPRNDKSAASGARPTRTARESASSRQSRAERSTTPAPPRHGIRVSAESVLRLANGGARPRGSPVRATPERPAGIELHGVSALGIGLRDGDVLTHAGGRPARSEADVVAIVLASRGAQAAEISGRFYRDGEAWNLIVEQPYVKRASGIAADTEVNRQSVPVRARKVVAHAERRRTPARQRLLSTRTLADDQRGRR